MSPSQDARRSPSSRMRVTAAIIGNALEFYDFTVYGIFATWLAKAFFPADNPNVSLLLAIATFGVGFVARPLGGVVIGAYADRFGRKPAMTLTIWLMALGSGMIGALPTLRPGRRAGARAAGACTSAAGLFDRRRNGACDHLSA
jgi:MFS family permease